jgi:dolichol kinase
VKDILYNKAIYDWFKKLPFIIILYGIEICGINTTPYSSGPSTPLRDRFIPLSKNLSCQLDNDREKYINIHISPYSAGSLKVTEVCFTPGTISDFLRTTYSK